MSVHASASRPSTCSGAMYGMVPSTVPCSVRGRLFVSSSAVLLELGDPELGQTEVEELHATLVSMTLLGFRSR